jgi:hypothetical protein
VSFYVDDGIKILHNALLNFLRRADVGKMDSSCWSESWPMAIEIRVLLWHTEPYLIFASSTLDDDGELFILLNWSHASSP